MIEVREAVEAAEQFARDAFGEDELKYLRLEEIELDEVGEEWKVTLGWVTPEDLSRFQARKGLAVITGPPGKLPRTYKLFRVNAETGEVKSMKIRDV